MTEDEWNQCHPEQAHAYLDAWINQQKREDNRLASLQLIIAQSAGIKINRRQPRLSDFQPKYAQPEKDDGTSALMEEVAKALAKQNQ